MNLEDLNALLGGTGIQIKDKYNHTKASESYVDVVITEANNTIMWEGAIPYQYRRTGLFLSTEEEVASYLISVKDHFKSDNIGKWICRERKYWEENYKAPVTTPFFHTLLSMDWVYEFPDNRNPQRRIQDIKEKGYTIASKSEGKKFKHRLLPLPRGIIQGYETIPAELRTRILTILNFENVYESSAANRQGLLPDHKFPEIRWDAETRRANQADMSEDDIRAKFQLLDNQRNQQKREVCRHCFQTGERGTPFGVRYFYAGTGRWSDDVPQVGAEAEQGCVGCGWYDIREWRDSLNGLIDNLKQSLDYNPDNSS